MTKIQRAEYFAQRTKSKKKSTDFVSEIDVQELNGLDMGSILHSASSCTNIVQHIANEMRKQNYSECYPVKIQIFYHR